MEDSEDEFEQRERVLARERQLAINSKTALINVLRSIPSMLRPRILAAALADLDLDLDEETGIAVDEETPGSVRQVAPMTWAVSGRSRS